MTLYAYTGTWLADFPANHYTHFVGLLLQPSKEEVGQSVLPDTLIYLNDSFLDGSDDEGGTGGRCCLIYCLISLSLYG